MKPNLLIIDDNDNRLNKLLALFRTNSNIYRCNISKAYIESDEEVSGLWKKVVSLPEFTLLLIHAGNKDMKDIVPAKWRIWYGGYGADDVRVLENEPIINKKLQTSHVLTVNEAQELVDFILDKQVCPNFLLIPNSKDAILEQRFDYIEKLGLPAHFDWTLPPPPHLFADCISSWEKFKLAALELLDSHTDLDPTHKKYLDYTRLLADLRKNTIEKFY